MICLLLGACAQLHPYQRPAMEMPPQYQGAFDLWQPAAPGDRLSRGDWWRRFGDPVLNDLMELLDAANADIAIAAANYQRAVAFAAQARAGLFPSVTAGAFTTHNRQSDTRALRSSTQPDIYNDNALSLGASYELDLWGRVRSQVEAGAAGVQAAQAELESVRLSLRAELATDYLTLRTVELRQELLAQQVDALNTLAVLTELRLQGDIDSALDLAQAQARLDAVRSQEAQNRSLRALLLHAVATLIGKPASTFTLALGALPSAPPAVPLMLPSQLLQRRPDIAAAERRLAQANATVGIANAAFYPVLNLSLAGGFESTYATSLLGAPNIFWVIGPSALLTLFDAGRRQALLAQAQASYVAAGERYRSTVLHALQEVEDQLSLSNELARAAHAQEDLMIEQRKTLSILTIRYEEGTVSEISVLDAKAQLYQAALGDAELRLRRLQACVALIRALGGGWEGTDFRSSSQPQ